MYPLSLTAMHGNWRKFNIRKKTTAFPAAEKAVFTRDRHTCQFCGFQAQEFQEVVNLDNNYSNNKISNLVTACCFCSQCLFLEVVGIDDMSGGQLIYLPEISQSDLNSFCHVLFCAMGNGTSYEDSAQALYRDLKFRARIVEEKFGVGFSDPAVMGRMMVEYQANHPEASYPFIKDLRLLPAFTKFKTQLDAWAASAMAELAEGPAKEAA